MRSMDNLNMLIKNWHIKANQQEDYFSKYVFEYLSFIAHLKNNLFIEETQDRRAIQALKKSTTQRDNYLKIILQDKEIEKVWNTVIKEIGNEPLHNSSHNYEVPEIDRWWNSSENEPNRATDKKKGVIHNTADWENMVEFWVAIRNNLFHGGKNPNIERDYFLVRHAYLTMSPFMELQIRALSC